MSIVLDAVTDGVMDGVTDGRGIMRAGVMLSRPVYQALLIVLTLSAAAGGLWLLIAPSPSPGVEITFPPTPSVVAASPATDDIVTTPSPGLVSLNTATAQELEELPGIGEVLAARIVAYWDEQGPFLRVDQVMAVSGIGPATYERIRGLVTVGE